MSFKALERLIVQIIFHYRIADAVKFVFFARLRYLLLSLIHTEKIQGIKILSRDHGFLRIIVFDTGRDSTKHSTRGSYADFL